MSTPQARGRRYKAGFTLTGEPAAAGAQLSFTLGYQRLHMSRTTMRANRGMCQNATHIRLPQYSSNPLKTNWNSMSLAQRTSKK